MSLDNDVSSVLQQYVADTGVRSTEKVEQDFIELSRQVSTAEVKTGLSEAFRSEHTPPFEEMVGQLFEQGNAQQRAGMLNQLLDEAGPSVVQPLVERGLLQDGMHSTDIHKSAVTPETAEQVRPELVAEIARKIEQENPGVVDKMSNFCAEEPALVKTLGGSTLSVALGKIAESR